MVDFNNKANFFSKNNIPFDVKKSKDVLDKDSVKARDILANKTGEKDGLVNKMSDVFPQSNNNSDGDFLS